MLIDIKEKVVLVTGSSKGIGAAIVKRFAEENSKVIINYNKSYEEAKELHNSLMLNSVDSLLVKADVTKVDEVNYLINETIKKFGKIDVLINNAGVKNDKSISDMSLTDWDEVVDTNLKGTFLCCKVVLPYMSQRGKGKIFNICSLKGQKGSVNQSNYCASKAAVISLTKTIAMEYGKYNISVNGICPGYIPTTLNSKDQILVKEEQARQESVLSNDNCLNDLLSFLVYASSDNFSNVSGRIFNLDSRIK